MDHNYPDDDLLTRYWLNEVNTEEEAVVVRWIEADVRNRRYFEELEKMWLMSGFKNQDDISVEKEWLRFKQSISENKNLLSDEDTQELQQENYEINSGGRGRIYKILISVCVAASVLFILAFGGLFSKTDKADIPFSAANKNRPNAEEISRLRHEVNKTGKPKKLMLQDGSEIVLEEKSEVSFTEPFDKNKRTVTLSGKAHFKVAKDKSSPFTVFSDALSTTVLGTVFDITAFKKSNVISVKLYEGLVVVNSIGAEITGHKKGIILSPGLEMLYNKKTSLAKVRRFGITNTATSSKKNIDDINRDNPNIPGHNKTSWFMFNNQSLEQVFEQLKEMYKMEIVYNKKDIKKLYFIGQFNKADSLETILNEIAISNGLKIRRNNNTFIIEK